MPLTAYVAIVIAALLAYLLGRRAATSLSIDYAAKLATANARAERVPGLERDIAQLRVSIEQARQSEVALRATLESERAAMEDKQRTLRDVEEQMKNAFGTLSAAALNSNTEQFLRLAKDFLEKFNDSASKDLGARQKVIDETVKPIAETLSKMETVLQKVEEGRASSDSAIREQFRSIVEANSQLRSETNNLVKALRTPHVRGRWGEIQLKNVVEIAGMLPYCDFEEQRQSDDGKRPDLLVNLPGGKVIVVDAKAPIEAYLTAMDETDDDLRSLKLADHARQVRDHITKLSSKAYWDQFPSTPEFVVMFLPGESFFSTALQWDASLIEYGVQRKVIPASPTTLIALLRAVAYGWRQEQIAENAQLVEKLGRELYERIGNVVNMFADVGDHLEKSVIAYNKAVGSVESRLIVTARKLREMGVHDAEPPEAQKVDRAVRRFESPELLPAQTALVEEPAQASLEDLLSE